jgi:multidrug efflux pump subunit AcrA (membrane-fusion protein)
MSELILPNPTQQILLPNESARGAIIAGIGVLAVFFFGLGGWAAFAPLNGAIIAPAVVKVEGNRKTIQHLDGGIVKELLVKEGDRVAPGQTVVVLEDTQAGAAVDVLSQQSTCRVPRRRDCWPNATARKRFRFRTSSRLD